MNPGPATSTAKIPYWFSRARLLEENDIENLSMVYSVRVFQMLKITSEVAF